ncbi:hypothetical protein KR51_00029870 [Rubidibacter lacunae KORDI 51-2]|uniref:Uncharacterized protein n=1 Tax=Rubidibacter lacunae KORDI 51-2 TaxID=582515 RepID=U5DFS0_9CHRO|nr:hypothetical protein [Rubidibacter lacunae]ERN40446.1 hypothetical protein KR51_00029870 [Rubidibacter lacunae KORDI 51-2]
MAIIALKAWYLERYEPIREVVKRPHDLRLNKNSLLKTGLRADFLEERLDVQSTVWFQRYLEGEAVEFYIEGSGGYAIANIDLVSHEIYFVKQDVSARLDPTIYLCFQSEYEPARSALAQALERAIAKLGKKSRVPLSLQSSPRPADGPMRLSSTQLRQIRKCLLLIADTTAIARVGGDEDASLLLGSNTCVELGFALQTKRPGEILLVSMERPNLRGTMPFDLPNHQQLQYGTAKDLDRSLPQILEMLLQRFNLFV